MKLKTICTLALATALASPVAAQQNDNGNDQDRIDKHLATSLILASRTEKKLSKSVKEKVDNEDVEEFARSMQEEYEELTSKLEEFAPEAAEAQLSDDDDGDRRRGRARRMRGQMRITRDPDQVDRKLFTIQRRAAERSLSLAKDEIEELDEEDLKQTYVSRQIDAQIALLGMLSAAERSASDDLKKVIREATDRTLDNLREAKDLRRDLREES